MRKDWFQLNVSYVVSIIIVFQKNADSTADIPGKSGSRLARKDGLVQARESKQQKKSGTREDAMEKKRLKREVKKRQMVKGD